MTIKQRIVAASAAIAFIVGLSACGSPNLEAARDGKQLVITNKAENPVVIKAVKFPKQDCGEHEHARVYRLQTHTPELSEPLKYGESRAFFYSCKGHTTLLHAVVETDQGDMEFNWE